jgi:hypothetical protein
MAIAQVAATYAAVGSSVMLAYGRVLRDLPGVAGLLEPRPGDSLRGYVQAFIASPSMAFGLYVAAALAAIALTIRIWRSEAPLDLRLASMAIAIILVNPHVNAYDLLLLAPVCVLLANWSARPSPACGLDERRASTRGIHAMPWLLALLFTAPILGAAPDAIRLQCSVGAMAADLLLVGYLLNRRIWFWMPWNAGATSAAVGA